MNDGSKGSKWIWIGIIGIIIIIAIALSITSFNSRSNSQNFIVCNYPETNINNSCCTDNNIDNICDANEKLSFDVNKILVSFEGETKQDLYLNGEGGPTSTSGFVEITNNNLKRICLNVYCENLINSYEGGCWPKQQSPSNLCVEGNSKRSVEIRMISSIIPETITGSYSGKIQVDLTSYYDELQKEDIDNYQTIKSYPLLINVHDLR